MKGQEHRSCPGLPGALPRSLRKKPPMFTLPLTTRASVLALAAIAMPTLSAQSYSVQRIEQDPAASSIFGTGLNDLGHVVGWAQFFGGGPVLRSWIWTPETGVTFLVPPPGQSLLRAMDVNDADVIAGDGGYDTGVAWRWTAGAIQLLGVLPGRDPVRT